MDSTPNGLNPEGTQPQIESTLNGLNAERTQPRMDSIPKGLNPEGTQSWLGFNHEWTQPQKGLNLDFLSTSNGKISTPAIFFIHKTIYKTWKNGFKIVLFSLYMNQGIYIKRMDLKREKITYFVKKGYQGINIRVQLHVEKLETDCASGWVPVGVESILFWVPFVAKSVLRWVPL
jgi:hypothetical protein